MKTKANYKIIQETVKEYYHAFFNEKKWGFIDILNRTVIPFRYEDVCINKNAEASKLFCVKANNLWGFIDKKRNTVIKFVFDNVRISAYNPKVYTLIQKEKFVICKTYQNYGLVDSVKGQFLINSGVKILKRGCYEK